MQFCKVINRLMLLFAVIFLSSCARILPLDYSDYKGKDAAKIVVQNLKGNVGTIYLSEYAQTDKCYDMTSRYQLVSNFFTSKGMVLEHTVKPGGLMLLQQIITKDTYYTTYWTSFIPEAGKRYFISSGLGVTEIPEDKLILATASPEAILKQYGARKVKTWDVHQRCTHYFDYS